MTIELSVVYDGDEPGLAEHRLSLAAFAEPMRLLLSALRRTASGLLSSALDDPEYGSRGGKLAREAALLDLELGIIREGCAAPSFAVVIRPDRRRPQTRMPLDDLPARAAEKLVRDIGAESKGVLQNASARQYLRSLPRGLTRQVYLAARDGRELARVEFGEALLGELPEEAPRLVRVTGHVVAVGFAPGDPSVTLHSEQGTQKYAAKASGSEQAIALRGKEVVAAALIAKEPRLLWIRSAVEPHEAASMEKTIAHLETRWGRTLAVLAQ
jgi:hypothetical protein